MTRINARVNTDLKMPSFSQLLLSSSHAYGGSSSAGANAAHSSRRRIGSLGYDGLVLNWGGSRSEGTGHCRLLLGLFLRDFGSQIFCGGAHRTTVSNGFPLSSPTSCTPM